MHKGFYQDEKLKIWALNFRGGLDHCATQPTGNCNHRLENFRLQTGQFQIGRFQTGRFEMPRFLFSELQRSD